MKETKKQLKAQLINELTKKFENKYGRIEDDLKDLRVNHQKIIEENYELRTTNNKLKIKIEQYEDWIERLQEFCNMDDDARTKAIKQYEAEQKVSGMLKNFLDSSSSFWDLLKII